jgi:serine/threonine protein kinase
MGEVYRARDSKLNRDVALKVLLPDVATDPDRLARFSREAQVLASLNHPNIAQIHGLEDSGERGALVMELVEGPTLADRIARGPMPLDEVMPIATQIAEALEAAVARLGGSQWSRKRPLAHARRTLLQGRVRSGRSSRGGRVRGTLLRTVDDLDFGPGSQHLTAYDVRGRQPRAGVVAGRR